MPTKAQLKELESYLELRSYKLLLKTSESGLYLRCPTRTHGSVAANVSWFLSSINFKRTENSNMPMRIFGSADQKVSDRVHQPDMCTQVINRTHNSANFIEETHYRSSQSMHAFHQGLRNLILQTHNVMLVMGVKVYPFDTHGRFAAIVVLYERLPNNPPTSHTISASAPWRPHKPTSTSGRPRPTSR